MIGMTIAVMKRFAGEDVIPRSFQLGTVETPKAPSLGLLLERQEFKGYNNKFGQDGLHLPIQWESLEEQVAAFRDQFIYPHIVQQEVEEKSMFQWLGNLNKHSFDNGQPSGEAAIEAPPAENKEISDTQGTSQTDTTSVVGEASSGHAKKEEIPGSSEEPVKSTS